MGVTKKCQEEREECTEQAGGSEETLVEEMGREEGAQRGHAPGGSHCRHFALLWPW